MRLLVLAAYRSDGLPRDHLIRRVRYDLRRAGRLEEVVLSPLPQEETGSLIEEVLGVPAAPSLVDAVHDRTQGLPFFVEELGRALTVTGGLVEGSAGLELVETAEVPIPDTVRDAVLVGVSDLSEEARAAADAAAVAGETVDLDVIAEISSAAGVGELIESGVVVETGPALGAFRHALTREALYADVPWLRRRGLHRTLAEALEEKGAGSSEIASHWVGAREPARAREALLVADEEFRKLHAYRDAARSARQALELWPEGEDEQRRLECLESYAGSAERSGQLAEAARAWREICDLRAAAGGEPLARAQRGLAAVHELRGDREAAFTAREAAAAAYSADGCSAEAAVERLAMANYLRAGADYSAAIELTRAAVADADQAARLDLRARALGLEGVARAKRGESEAGLEAVQSGLSLALEHDMTPVAAELYQRLSLVLYDGADYRQAQEALDNALGLCRADDTGTAVACVTCMVYVLRECGEWDEALKLGRELISSDTAVWVAQGLVGAIHGYQGKLTSARRLLSSSLATASKVGHFNMSVDTTAGLAWVAAAEGDREEAAGHCRAVLARWEGSEDKHYAVRGLRWSAAHFAREGDLGGAHACSEALASIASDTARAEALAALGHALGETALANGDPDGAAEQLRQAVDLHRSLDIPFERAEIELRAGVALGAAGEREPALEALGEAYRTFRRLGARPMATEAALEVKKLGESVAGRLGKRGAADADGAGLTRRELEVVRLVAVGRTNREIAEGLVLSPRTVDMHVRNVLRKLDCRSRAAAAHRAGELGLLA